MRKVKKTFVWCSLLTLTLLGGSLILSGPQGTTGESVIPSMDRENRSCPVPEEERASDPSLESLSIEVKGLRNKSLEKVREEFQRKFQGIIQNRCTVCHGPGGLREDIPLSTFEDLLKNPSSIAQSLKGDMGQYAQSDRKILLRWFEESLIPSMEKSSMAEIPSSAEPQDYLDTPLTDGWQEKKPKAYPHPKNWDKTHRFRARVDRKSCMLCHQAQSFCLDCHNKVTPKDHNTRQWIANTHQLKGRIQPQSCASCHAPNFCSNCHFKPFK